MCVTVTPNSLSEMPKVLLLDDDEVFRMALGKMMKRRNFNVFTAQHIAQARQLLIEENPEVAVVDLCLGDESGLAAIEQLLQIKADLRITLLTGYASIATAVEAIKLGATHYLTKPAEVDDIIASFARDKGRADAPTGKDPMSVKRLEWEHLQKVLQAHQGNISAAARALGMHRRTLQRKLQKKPVRE